MMKCRRSFCLAVLLTVAFTAERARADCATAPASCPGFETFVKKFCAAYESAWDNPANFPNLDPLIAESYERSAPGPKGTAGIANDEHLIHKGQQGWENLKTLISDAHSMYFKTLDVTPDLANGSCKLNAKNELRYLTLPWSVAVTSTNKSGSAAGSSTIWFDSGRMYHELVEIASTEDAKLIEVSNDQIASASAAVKSRAAAASTGGGQSGPSFGMLHGHITLNGANPLTGTRVDCIDGGGSPYPYGLTDANGNYACTGVTAGTVTLKASGQQDGPCPRPVQNDLDEVCDAKITGCGSSATVEFALILPLALGGRRLRRGLRHSARNRPEDGRPR